MSKELILNEEQKKRIAELFLQNKPVILVYDKLSYVVYSILNIKVECRDEISNLIDWEYQGYYLQKNGWDYISF